VAAFGLFERELVILLGHTYIYDGRAWKCDLLNESRARLTPVARKTKVFETVGGKKVEFTAPDTSVSISPQSELPCVKPLAKGVKK